MPRIEDMTREQKIARGRSMILKLMDELAQKDPSLPSLKELNDQFMKNKKNNKKT